MPEVDQKALRQVIKTVAEKKASWPTEIAAFTDFDEKTVGQICRQLVEANYFERLHPRFTNGDKRLEERAAAVNGGMQSMKARDWYALNSEISWRMKVWNEDRIVNEFHEEVGTVPPDKDKEEILENNYIEKAVDRLEERGLL